MQRAGEPEAALPGVAPAPVAPAPVGMTLALDAVTVAIEGGSALLGGMPRRLLRLSPRGAGLVSEWAAGGSIGSDPAERRFARRLLDAGLAHPVGFAPGDAAAVADQVSVVVPTRDRPREVARLLGSLGGLRVIVADDGSLDGRTCAVASHFGATYLRSDVARGPAAARNLGLGAVTTPLVAFVDSDCVPRPGWLDELVAHFADPCVAACAPRVAPLGDARAWWARYDRARSPLDLGTGAATVRPGSRVSFVPSAALVVRRSALEDGCFDERLLAAEDVDLVWRLAEAGWTIRYEPRAEVGHDQRPGPVAMLRQRSSYGATAGPLGRRHPTEIAPVAAAPMTLVAGALLAGRRPWLALGVAAAGTGVAAARLSRSVPTPLAVRLATEGTTRGALPFLAGCFRAYGPLLVAGAVASKRLRAPALVIAVAPALGAWGASARELDPARYVLGHVAEDLAYGIGVWRGALAARTAAPLVPRLIRRRRTPGGTQALKLTTPRMLEPASRSS